MFCILTKYHAHWLKIETIAQGQLLNYPVFRRLNHPYTRSNKQISRLSGNIFSHYVCRQWISKITRQASTVERRSVESKISGYHRGIEILDFLIYKGIRLSTPGSFLANTSTILKESRKLIAECNFCYPFFNQNV